MMFVFREPLVQFFLLGGAIFGLFQLVDDTPPLVAEDALVVTDNDAQRLLDEFEATWRRRPTARELDFMIDERVREEVYVREALALGFDRDDAVIRRRLQMKMEFLTESSAEALAPDDATLEAHLAAYPERFAEPARVAFEQILLNGELERDETLLVVARLNAGGTPGGASRPTLLPGVFRSSPTSIVDGTFGTGFFGELTTLPMNEWSGPVASSLGLHLVHVTERQGARVPPLAEVRDRVEQDWRATAIQALRNERYEALLSQYKVGRPDPMQVLRR